MGRGGLTCPVDPKEEEEETETQRKRERARVCAVAQTPKRSQKRPGEGVVWGLPVQFSP